MNRIHPTAVIGPGVELGTDNIIGPHAVILGPTFIGDGNWIGPSVVIGTPGEMRGGPHPAGWEDVPDNGGIHIGNRNVIREFATVQSPSEGRTAIGDDCYLMTKCHVPHEGVLGDRVTVACAVMIGGHGIIGDGANLGLGAVLHQRLVVGAGAMVGMGSVVTRHVPPFAKVMGNPARVRGANTVGMSRAGVPDEVVAQLNAAYAEDRSGDVVAAPPVELSTQFAGYASAVGDH